MGQTDMVKYFYNSFGTDIGADNSSQIMPMKKLWWSKSVSGLATMIFYCYDLTAIIRTYIIFLMVHFEKHCMLKNHNTQQRNFWAKKRIQRVTGKQREQTSESGSELWTLGHKTVEKLMLQV